MTTFSPDICMPAANAFKMSAAEHHTFSSIFNGLPLKIEIKPRMWGRSPRNLRRLRWFLRKSKQNFIYSSLPTARSRGVAPKLRLFILSFCRSVKESIKESAFERRQELPAGTGAAPLCQPLKFSADYRDVTATLKMKRLRRLWGDRRTFLAVAMIFRQRRRREQGASAHAYFTSISKS